MYSLTGHILWNWLDRLLAPYLTSLMWLEGGALYPLLFPGYRDLIILYIINIIESVDSISRDGPDVTYT